jgi:flagellar motor protein MotB
MPEASFRRRSGWRLAAARNEAVREAFLQKQYEASRFLL